MTQWELLEGQRRRQRRSPSRHADTPAQPLQRQSAAVAAGLNQIGRIAWSRHDRTAGHAAGGDRSKGGLAFTSAQLWDARQKK